MMAVRSDTRNVEHLAILLASDAGAVSTQVLAEFYSAATRKLKMPSQKAENVIADMHLWTIHRPEHADLVLAARLERRHKISWWDALIVQSAGALGCNVLWSEDLSAGQRYGTVIARNLFV